MRELQRNAPCPCGSGIKYKKCCRLTQGPLEEGWKVETGRAILCVTDWYVVHDQHRLTRLFGRQPEVDGSFEQGWNRIDTTHRECEPSATLVIDDQGRLEVTTGDEFFAETTRWWLERIAGELVSHEIGQVSAEDSWGGTELTIDETVGDPKSATYVAVALPLSPGGENQTSMDFTADCGQTI